MHRNYPPKAATVIAQTLTIRVRYAHGPEATRTLEIIPRFKGTSFVDAEHGGRFIANRDPEVAVRCLCESYGWTLLEILP